MGLTGKDKWKSAVSKTSPLGVKNQDSKENFAKLRGATRTKDVKKVAKEWANSKPVAKKSVGTAKVPTKGKK